MSLSPSSSPSDSGDQQPPREVGYFGALFRGTRTAVLRARFLASAERSAAEAASSARMVAASSKASRAVAAGAASEMRAAKIIAATGESAGSLSRALKLMKLPRARTLMQNFRRAKTVPTSFDVSETLHKPLGFGQTIVTAAWAVSVAYVVNDIALEYHEKRRAVGLSLSDTSHFVLERAVFHGAATFLLPHLVIHSTIHVVEALCHSLQHLHQHDHHHHHPALPPRGRMGSFCLRWAPTLCGLATVPLLPLFFDAPLERAAEYVADSVWPISYDAHKKLAATAGSAHHHHHHHQKHHH